MKWYRNLAVALITALEEIFNHRKQADKVVNGLLKSNKKWGSRDRKFLAQGLYDIVRWKRLYEYLAGTDIQTPEGKWRVIGVWAVLNRIDLPYWKEFERLNPAQIIRKYKTIPGEAIKQSVPDWLFRLGNTQLGDRWVTELKAMNEEAPLTIRVNRLKTNPERLIKILEKEGVVSYGHPSYPDALFIKERKKLTYLKSYRQGLFEIQDTSSQLVAPFTGAMPGNTVIDACAGAGGKTLHLATQMQNKGQIMAYDIYQTKIEELHHRAKRNGVKNIVEATVITPEIIEKNRQKADVLLLDAPCSSLGTLRRNPGLKWELNLDKIKKINSLQKNIINDYEQMLQPGGYLIYVTCSILPMENQMIVNDFLNTHKNYTFVEDMTVLPSSATGDGFYMAKLKKHL